MHFAYPLPWWLAVLLAAAIAAVAYGEYRRPLSPLTRDQRGVLVALRVLALAISSCFSSARLRSCRRPDSRDAIVPILVDASRSMRLDDADGQTRVARAAALLKNELGAVALVALHDRALHRRRRARAGERRRPDRRRAAHRSRRRARPRSASGIAASASPGIIVLSDGGDTAGRVGRLGRAGRRRWRAVEAGGPPVFAVGIGSPDGPRDREVLGISAGDPRLDHASVDLHVSAMSTGFGRAPFTLRVLGNGQLLDTRRIVPPADGSPIDEVFTVSPDPLNPTVYTAEIARDEIGDGRREQRAQRAGQPGRPQAAAARSSKARPATSTAS